MSALAGYLSATYVADEATVTCTPSTACDTYLAGLPNPGSALTSEWAWKVGTNTYRTSHLAATKCDGTYVAPPASQTPDFRQPTGLTR